ncbi:MAG: biotin--[acetyl-CoA-carboxylase] ligase [Planctomycetes bacterium]|nr:biotin--[acetyl-CoA-carboxylase] ligase [Planctomycetota bacterium]
MKTFAYDTVDSTNEQAKRLIAAGEVRDVACVVAGEQTRGKGTRGRSWSSPPGAGIYLSLVRVFERGEVRPTTLFTLAAGVACAEVLVEWTGITVHLKPINDLWADGGKLGGILTETTVAGADVTGLVVGVGINVSAVPRIVSSGAARPVSLQDLLPPERFARVAPRSIATALADRLLAWCAAAAGGEEAKIRAAWSRFVLPGAVLPESL